MSPNFFEIPRDILTRLNGPEDNCKSDWPNKYLLWGCVGFALGAIFAYYIG